VSRGQVDINSINSSKFNTEYNDRGKRRLSVSSLLNVASAANDNYQQCEQTQPAECWAERGLASRLRSAFKQNYHVSHGQIV